MEKRVSVVSPEAWAALSGADGLLDRVAEVLTYYKLESSIRRELGGLGLKADVVDALADCRFSGNGHLSRETLLAILPHMEDGKSYVDACAAAGLHHSRKAEGKRHRKLPPIPSDEVRNPVVLRALTQTRKVLNAIIEEFGSPEALHVELGRDVGRSYADRRLIERRQTEGRARNDAVLEQMRTDFGVANPRPLDRVKFRLWREQDSRCAYSGAYIDGRELLSGAPGVAEVDHILPFSRSFDDGYLNKVLVTTAENRAKREQTPFEYMGGDAVRWHEFEERVRVMAMPYAKKERLLRRVFDEHASEEYRERNLVDMRYIARFFKNFAEQNLRFAGDAKAPVVTVNGRATAYLRTAWQLQKVRSEGDLHHALDAAVIAACTRSMVQQVSRFFSARQMRKHGGVYVDPVTGEVVEAKHVPEPWDGFSADLSSRLEARFGADPLADLQDPALTPRPILVSRMPARSVRGEVHKDTVRRIEGRDGSGRLMSSKRVRLEDLTAGALERMVGRERDQVLYATLKTRLEAHGEDARKAFAEPLYKPTAAGRIAPRVRAIRVYDEPASGGVHVRGGLADNGVMVRTDVFERDGKYYLVPVYLDAVARGELPNRACVAGKAESDWRLMDASYTFRFSLHNNDPVRLVKRGADSPLVIFGYYKGANRATGTITIEAHDAAWSKGSLGINQGIVAFDKLAVDILGRRVAVVQREKRSGFPLGDHRQ